VTARELDDSALSFLLTADAHHSGPMDRFFAAVRDVLDLGEPTHQLWGQYRRRMPELAACRPEDLDALRQLRQAGWRIGIVTNGMTDNQTGKIGRTGLAALVDGWCVSEEAGARKPDPKIFQLAAQRCGASVDHGGWMVGDNPVLDIAGGHAAGLRTIWVPPANQPRPVAGPAPDFTANSVAAAVAVILTST